MITYKELAEELVRGWFDTENSGFATYHANENFGDFISDWFGDERDIHITDSFCYDKDLRLFYTYAFDYILSDDLDSKCDIELKSDHAENVYIFVVE